MPMTANILHKWRAQIQLNSTKQHTSPYQISQFISFNSGCTYHESICWLVHMCRKGGACRVQYHEKFILVSLRGFSAHVFHKMRYSPQLWGCWLVFVAFFGTLNSAKLTILYSTEYEDDRQGADEERHVNSLICLSVVDYFSATDSGRTAEKLLTCNHIKLSQWNTSSLWLTVSGGP